jgi:uncharacterized protein YjbI with pentapeptide repeats
MTGLHRKVLTKVAPFEGLDLRGLDLRGVDLRSVDLRGLYSRST